MVTLRYRKVHVRLWRDERFRRLSKAPPNGQTLWLHLLTCPISGAVPGLIAVGEAALAEELGWPLEGLRTAFAELEREGMAKADWKARLIWLPRGIEYGRPDNPSVILSWRMAWDELPECDLKREAEGALERYLDGIGASFTRAFRTVCHAEPPEGTAPDGAPGGTPGVAPGGGRAWGRVAARAETPVGGPGGLGARHKEKEKEKEIPPRAREPKAEPEADKAEDGDGDPWGAGAEAAATRPDNAYSLICAMRAEASRARPELGLWNPGRFATKDAQEFYDGIAARKLPEVARLIRERIPLYFRLDDPAVRRQGWPVKFFLDRLSSLALPEAPRAAAPSAVVMAPARRYFDPNEESAS